MPKLIFGTSPYSQIFKLIERNLKHHNFDVISIVKDSPFQYPNIIAHLKTKLVRLFGKDIKQSMIDQSTFDYVFSTLKHLEKADYALFLGGSGIYHRQILNFVRQKTTGSMINFQQDSVKRNCCELNTALFDHFYVSDPTDLNLSEQYLPSTNFYFDYDLNIPDDDTYDFYFIGMEMKSRRDAILLFSEYAKQKGLKLKFDLYDEKRKIPKLRKIYKNDNINLISEFVDYETNLNIAKQSKVLVDFVIGEHNVLSYRVFEALGFKKKLVTTNQTVQYYDFYHPNNILIWNGEDLNGLDEFLAKPYVEIDEQIREKYSFGNWIRYILDIPPYQKIELPAIPN